MRAVATGCGQCASVQVDAISGELATQLWILVIEVLHCITEPVAIPIDNYHVAISACKIFHLLVDFALYLWRDDADGVANADYNFWPAHPKIWKVALQQVIQLNRIALNVLHVALS